MFFVFKLDSTEWAIIYDCLASANNYWKPDTMFHAASDNTDTCWVKSIAGKATHQKDEVQKRTFLNSSQYCEKYYPDRRSACSNSQADTPDGF